MKCINSNPAWWTSYNLDDKQESAGYSMLNVWSVNACPIKEKHFFFEVEEVLALLPQVSAQRN